MIPKKITYTIEVTGWQCLNPDHHHKTEDIAKRCIEKSTKPAKKKWTTEKLIELARRNIKGESMTDIAKDIGLSKSRASSLIARGYHILRKTGEIADKLS